MKEKRVIGFNTRVIGAARALRMLAKVGFDRDEFDLESFVTGMCMMTVEASDPRLEPLLGELRRLREEALIRAFREYTKAELDRVEWFRLIVKTVGLDGGLHYGQQYDRSGSCAKCGSGVRPIPPLTADTNRMGKKEFDVLAYEGYVVVTPTLAAALARKGLTGIEARPVRRLKRAELDSRFRWLAILGEWPPMNRKSNLDRDDPCFSCKRTGHFDSGEGVTEFSYGQPPSDAKDFNNTWEYFGVWRIDKPERDQRVGGSRAVIVSRKARQTLRQFRVRHLEFSPIGFDHRV